MPGPLPAENRRRRNKPTVPTTKLPVGGRTESVPRVPSWVKLGKHGRAWWRWAWTTPQACAWAPGHESMVARRAALEDDLAAIDQVTSLDAVELFEGLDPDAGRTVRDLISRLAALASSRLSIYREMRELDDRLGLTPKGMAQLRWTIVSDPAQDNEMPVPKGVADMREARRKRMSDAS